MKSSPSIVGLVSRVGLFDRLWKRAIFFGGLAFALALLSLYPERHRAVTSLTPTDPDSLGLSGTLGQLGAINNVFGNQAAVEIAMRVSKSIYVRDTVIKELKLTERLDESDVTRVHRWLERKVDIRSLRGGIITIEMTDRDPKLARDVVGAFANATQERLAEINRKRTAYKREVLFKLVADASTRLAQAQATFDTFRLNNRFTEPRSSISAIGDRIPVLEAAIKAREIKLATARQVFTDENITVKQILAELGSMRGQLAEAKATNPQLSNSVGKMVDTSSRLFILERDLAVARALYDSYTRYLQGTAVEDMTSSANIRVLEAPYIDTARQFNLPAVAAAIAMLLLWMAVEFYRVRPPIGEDLNSDENLGASNNHD